jgi:hypothetical protein
MGNFKVLYLLLKFPKDKYSITGTLSVPLSYYFDTYELQQCNPVFYHAYGMIEPRNKEDCIRKGADDAALY